MKLFRSLASALAALLLPAAAQAARLTLLAVLAVIPAILARAQLPAGSGLSITKGAVANSANVIIADPSNHTWILQSSSDLSTWSDMETLKVHNGRFQRKTATGTSAASMLFFRAIHDPAQQILTSTLANSLLLPAAPDNYANPDLPPEFLDISDTDNTPANNPVTDAGAVLGRVLFYDKRLSRNQTVSCSSCHTQKLAFSDGKRFSTGFAGGTTARNSMGLSNVRWYNRGHFLRDERANTLEDQVLMPIENPIEMGFTLAELQVRLAAEPFYADLFSLAFGDAAITPERLSRALAQFIRSIVSLKSKLDIGRPSNFQNFTAQELQGREIFLGVGRCSSCHSGVNSIAFGSPSNNGLEFPYVDLGIGGITGLASQDGVFKVSSLRNVELTGPYMHDGRFATLEEVVEFYNSGIVFGPNLSGLLRTGSGPKRFNFTADQKAALVAYMKTFTDMSLTTDPKFSDPFNYGDESGPPASFVGLQTTGTTVSGKTATAKAQLRR